ncbi:hypothetical protein Bca4012_070970 [Brassica carinata]
MGVGSRVRLACGLLKLWSPVVKELDMKMLKKAKDQIQSCDLVKLYLVFTGCSCYNCHRVWFHGRKRSRVVKVYHQQRN